MSIRTVHHLNCGTMCPIGGMLLGGPLGLGRGRMIAHVLLIETVRDGFVLVDTGFGTRDLEGKTGIRTPFKRVVGPAFDPAEPAVAQLAAMGVTADDVRHLVVTHLDLDHAGGISDFPRAKVHVHAREHAAAMTRTSRLERERYLPAHWAHGPSWEVYTEEGDRWRGLPAIARLRGLDADIGLVPMHGHTRGHSAVIARVGERWLVHAGDAYFHHHAMSGEGRVPLGFQVYERVCEMDGSARRASVAALRQLRESFSDVELFSAHDPEEFEHMRERANRAGNGVGRLDRVPPL